MRVFSIIILVVFLSSCKKSYRCSCRTVFNYPGGSETFEPSVKPIDKRLTKKQAKSVCDAEAAALEKTFNNWWSNNGAWPTQGIYARSTCLVDSDF